MNTKERKQFLKNKENDYIKERPELKDLRDKLISLGGNFVCLVFEEDLASLLSRGSVFKGKGSKLMKGEPSQCHANSAELWDLNKERLDIVTGWALSTDSDGLKVWRQHSWVYDNQTKKVIETTEKRTLYFGYTLNLDESQSFLDDNLF